MKRINLKNKKFNRQQLSFTTNWFVGVSQPRLWIRVEFIRIRIRSSKNSLDPNPSIWNSHLNFQLKIKFNLNDIYYLIKNLVNKYLKQSLILHDSRLKFESWYSDTFFKHRPKHPGPQPWSQLWLGGAI